MVISGLGSWEQTSSILQQLVCTESKEEYDLSNVYPNCSTAACSLKSRYLAYKLTTNSPIDQTAFNKERKKLASNVEILLPGKITVLQQFTSARLFLPACILFDMFVSIRSLKG